MISSVRLQEVRTLARTVLFERKLLQLPVDPMELARQLQILVQPFQPAQRDVSGFLMQVGNDFMIGYSTGIKSLGFQRFTVAHELGHYFIEDHAFALLQSGKHLSKSGFISKDRYELEADAFATELLMPWKLIQPLIRSSPGGLATVKAIAENCISSLVAAAVRYTQVTEECAAVIVSHQGEVEFMSASDSFKQIRGLDWLRRRDNLPVNTLSSNYSLATRWIEECESAEGSGPLGAWFPGTNCGDVEEDVIGLGCYGRLLTVLVVPDFEEDQEENEDGNDDYIDRWKTGIFRGKRN